MTFSMSEIQAMSTNTIRHLLSPEGVDIVFNATREPRRPEQLPYDRYLPYRNWQARWSWHRAKKIQIRTAMIAQLFSEQGAP